MRYIIILFLLALSAPAAAQIKTTTQDGLQLNNVVIIDGQVYPLTWPSDTGGVPTLGLVQKRIAEKTAGNDTVYVNYQTTPIEIMPPDYSINIAPTWFGDSGRMRMVYWFQPIRTAATGIDTSFNSQRALSFNGLGYKDYEFVWTSNGGAFNYFEVVADSLNGASIIGVTWDAYNLSGLTGDTRIARTAGASMPYDNGDTYFTSQIIFNTSTVADIEFNLVDGVANQNIDVSYAINPITGTYTVNQLLLRAYQGSAGAAAYMGTLRVWYVQNYAGEVWSEWGVKIENW